MIDIKVLGRTEVESHHTAYVTVLLTPLTLVPALWVWQMPSSGMWVWLIFIGVIGTIGQFVITEAIKLADMTVLMPFDFLKLVWAAFLGMLFFAGDPDALTWSARRSYSPVRSTSSGARPSCDACRRSKTCPRKVDPGQFRPAARYRAWPG